MTTQLAFTATDTTTGEQRIITDEYAEGLAEFSIDFLILNSNTTISMRKM